MHSHQMHMHMHIQSKRLEHLFFTYGVDIILEAHQHSYERLWPVYNATVTALNYNNPKAPVHLISGTVGCNEALGECFDPMLGPKGMSYRILLSSAFCEQCT